MLVVKGLFNSKVDPSVALGGDEIGINGDDIDEGVFGPAWPYVQNNLKLVYFFSRGKSLLELWVTNFFPDWQPPLIFVWFISNFLCMCSNSMASAHVILK